VLKELEKISLEYTAFYNGIFMDYYGSPLLQSHVGPFPIFVDIQNKQAALPGSGTEFVVFTRVLDIARFVVRSLDLSDWPKKSYIIGDRITLQDFVKLAEKARGIVQSFVGVSISLIP
jgi:nucleoside-diphosphate-sugar epimerase